MKIDAPRAWSSIQDGKVVNLAGPEKGFRGYVPVRIVRESDWRKIMAVVRAAEDEDKDGDKYLDDLGSAVADLRKYLRKLGSGLEDKVEDYERLERSLASLSARNAELTDKALRFDLDQLGIELREREAVELVELRAALAAKQPPPRDTP